MEDVIGWLGDFFDSLNDNSGAVQAIATVVLVMVTAFYVVLTRSLSKSAAKQADASAKMAEEMREQAEASVKMAEEMREQTIELRKAHSQQIRPVVRVNRVNGSLRGQPRVVIRNVGRGDATNGTAKIEGQGCRFKEQSYWSLSPDPEKDKPFTFERDEGEPQETVDSQPRIVIECDDMDGVRWRFVRKLRVDDNTGSLDLGEELVPEEVSHDS